MGFILKYVLGVGLGTALAFVLLAWHHHRAVRWFKPKFHTCREWLLGHKAALFPPRKQSSNSENARPTAGSSAYSSTLRSRGANVHKDLEKGK